MFGKKKEELSEADKILREFHNTLGSLYREIDNLAVKAFRKSLAVQVWPEGPRKQKAVHDLLDAQEILAITATAYETECDRYRQFIEENKNNFVYYAHYSDGKPLYKYSSVSYIVESAVFYANKKV